MHTDRTVIIAQHLIMFTATVWPSLLDNFIYTLPKIKNRGVDGLIDGVRYLFSRDLVIAESFCRKFVWHKVSCSQLAQIAIMIGLLHSTCS